MSLVSALHQRKFFHGKNKFKIKHGSHISVEQIRTSRKVAFDIDLVALCPDSTVQFNIAWHWLRAMIISLLIAGVLITTTQFIADKILLLYSEFFVIIMLGLFFIFFLLLILFSNRKCIFTTRHAKLPILEIIISNPNKSLYKAFIDGLENEIIITTENRQLSQKQQRAGELKTLRRLSQQGIISKNQYEQCKHILLHA